MTTWFDHVESLAKANGCRLIQTPEGDWYLATPDGRHFDLGATPTDSGGYADWEWAFREAGVI